jgi:hypothetical protein
MGTDRKEYYTLSESIIPTTVVLQYLPTSTKAAVFKRVTIIVTSRLNIVYEGQGRWANNQ